tara:strand:+ start:164 stop:979 length:816 start_codon:yes stop_codon:yes gene_type:complete
MPTFSNTTFSTFWKRILQFGHSGNNGTPTSTTNIQAGDGVATSLSLSDDVLSVQPVNDDTTATMLVKQSGGNNILAVDTTNSKVLVGASQVAANTQYAHFGIDSYTSASFSADQHYAIPFNPSASSAATVVSLGSSTSSSFNDTNPPTTKTTSSTGHLWASIFMYLPDNITVDAVHWWHGADAATGDDTAAHLMSYNILTGLGILNGDFSGGVVVADGATITNTGYENVAYQSMTIQSADVNAGRVLVFAFASDTVNSDYTVNATVKYHIR